MAKRARGTDGLVSALEAQVRVFLTLFTIFTCAWPCVDGVLEVFGAGTWGEGRGPAAGGPEEAAAGQAFPAFPGTWLGHGPPRAGAHGV